MCVWLVENHWKLLSNSSLQMATATVETTITIWYRQNVCPDNRHFDVSVAVAVATAVATRTSLTRHFFAGTAFAKYCSRQQQRRRRKERKGRVYGHALVYAIIVITVAIAVAMLRLKFEVKVRMPFRRPSNNRFSSV